MQLVSPRPGSLAEARVLLANAQGYAANVSNAPYADTLANLQAGVRDAARAASVLMVAEPRSEFQDLVAARQHVVEGQQLLEQAISAYGSAYGPDHGPQVKLLAGQAFDAFENAFEIIDND
ncbi:MAG: hypothetical protein KDC46_03750 [Thermoleophilia bacterium]|nr:hypothetical protein [Thermoleophilia bacterium]